MAVTVEFSDPIDKYFDAKDVTFGMQTAPHAGGPTHTASISHCTVTKVSDFLTPVLFDYMVTGTHIRIVWIRAYRAPNSGLFLIHTLKDVIISHMKVHEGIDTMGLDFGSIAAKGAWGP